ncbi:FliH/SctL family protein [Tropicibacter oceani]|uniref:ABC transporter ATP-binding protein n=1 Tax=Tropicibacter oceani TaxID=3058420 RepID=A0ABY8QI70_9RHOB|nr:ABC transporter ATP-binding protein [Tropicibacter oceani]WGW04339.1 ABC transporter ATP-binding protein [Tropicibacter oceani]
MTALRQLFEDFGGAAPTVPVETAPAFNEADLEGQRLEAFENGFKAGWDDAIKAQSDDKTRISSSFGQHLQDLSFTYHEACSQVMNAMTPLLNEMVNVLLPGMARATIGAHIVEKLHEMSREIGTLEVQIAVSPGNVEAVSGLLEEDFGFPVRLIEDSTLADEQADIRFGKTEKQIDLGELVRSVSEAIAGFAHENQRKLANG